MTTVLDDFEVLRALDETCEEEAGRGFDGSSARAVMVAKLIGKQLGVAWESGENWKPSASAVQKVALALGRLQKRGLVVRSKTTYSWVWSVTVEGDEVLAEHDC